MEDESDSRDLIAHMLERAGATVASVQSAADALEMIAWYRPDVLVSDIGLPRQDGYDLIRSLRRRSSPEGRIPAVAVTGYGRPEDRDRALAAGFQAFVPKPFAARDLIDNIKRLAER